jgi:putative transposase
MKPSRVHNFGTYFISATTWERRSLFQTERTATLFIETLYVYRSRSAYELHEFVVMPNHFHVILTPTDVTLERALQFIKGGFSHRYGKEVNAKTEVWQRGFTDHRIRDGEDYVQHRNYLVTNPVKAGLCSEPSQYKYSSASGLYELDAVPQRLKPVT